MEISGKLKLQQISSQSIFTDEAIDKLEIICNGSYSKYYSNQRDLEQQTTKFSLDLKEEIQQSDHFWVQRWKGES